MSLSEYHRNSPWRARSNPPPTSCDASEAMHLPPYRRNSQWRERSNPPPTTYDASVAMHRHRTAEPLPHGTPPEYSRSSPRREHSNASPTVPQNYPLTGHLQSTTEARRDASAAMRRPEYRRSATSRLPPPASSLTPTSEVEKFLPQSRAVKKHAVLRGPFLLHPCPSC